MRALAEDCASSISNMLSQSSFARVYTLRDHLRAWPAGLPWLLPRLKYAKALQIDTHRSTYGVVTRIRPLRETVSQLLNASRNLSELRVLVSPTLD